MARWTSAIALAALLVMPPAIGNANGPIQASGSFASACIVQ
jgi:hypothetical protein